MGVSTFVSINKLTAVFIFCFKYVILFSRQCLNLIETLKRIVYFNNIHDLTTHKVMIIQYYVYIILYTTKWVYYNYDT